MWIQLKSNKHIEVKGKQITYVAGDWVDVGKHLAMKWIADGSAHIPNQEINSEFIDYTAGVCVIGSINAQTRKKIESVANHLTIEEFTKPTLAYSETMIYDSQFSQLRPELIGIGFYWLKSFEVIMPIWDYKELACHIGTAEDREKTKAIISELRVPVYDNRLMFIRRSENTKRFIDRYNQLCEEIADKRLALLCAYYEVKPIALALPTTWIGKDR